MNIYEVILASIGGTATILLAIGFLVKSIINHFLSKDIEQFKTSIQFNTDKALEETKNTLHILAIEHEVRFSRLHDKRMEIIASLYSDLKNALNESENYLDFKSLISITDENKIEGLNERRKNTGDAIRSFRDNFDKNKIWLSESSCKKISTLYREFVIPIENFAAICAQEEIEGGWKETQVKIWEEACNKFTIEVPIALTMVEKEFRSLLGVLKKENS